MGPARMGRQAAGSSSTRGSGAQAPRQRRSQAERSSLAEQALLSAAAQLFAQRGVDQTSLAEVGELAGYSRGLANHHFGSKAALVERLSRQTQAEFVADFDAAGDEIEVLCALTSRYLTRIAADPDAARAFFVMWGSALPSEASLRPTFAADDAQFRDGVEVLLRRGQASKTVAAELDPKGGAVALVGMLRGVAAQYLIEPDEVAIDAAKASCEQFVRRTFAARRGRAKS